MYKQNFFTFLLLFLFSVSAFSQKTKKEYSALLIPNELLENADAVIRSENVLIDVKNKREAKKTIKKVITILNEDSHANTFVLYYGPGSEVKNITVNLYNKLGQGLRKMDKSEIKDYSANGRGFGDNRIKYLELNHSSYPYTIELTYEQKLRGMDFAFYLNWRIQRSPDESVQSACYTLTMPNDFDITHRAYHLENEPKIKQESEAKSYIWTVENISAVKREPFAGRNELKMPYIAVGAKDFQVEDYRGSLESWQKFGGFINTLWNGRDELSEEMKAKVHSMTAGVATDKEKIDILYRWMQDKMRYVSVQLGIGGWQTFPARYVEDNKFGDCKALTNFMMSMLKEVGIESDPALVYSGRYTPEYDEDFASPRFNHVILNVPSEDYWLECTSNYAPPNYLGRGTENKPVLLFNENGGTLSKTPTSNASANVAERKIEVNVSSDGSAIIKNTSRLHRHRESPWRYYSFEKSEEELRKYFQKNSALPTFQFEAFSVVPNREEPFTQLDFQVKINRYGSKAGKRLFVPVNVVSARSYVPPKAKETRISDVVLKNAKTDKDEIILSLPNSYEAESIPTGKKEVKTEFGSYSIEFEQRENKVICRRNFMIKALTLPPEKYAEVRQFYKDVAKLDKTQIVLVKRGNP